MSMGFEPASFSRKVLNSANSWATVVQQEKESIQMAKGLSKLNIDKTFMLSCIRS